MKQAEIRLSLNKHQQVRIKNVTPIEALLLTSLHQKNANGVPIEVVGPETDTGHLVEYEADEDRDEIVMEAGKKVVKTTKVKVKKTRIEPDNRSEDDELARLRTKYKAEFIKALCAEVRDFPKDFKGAIERGMKLALPTGSLSAGTASSIPLKG